MKVDISLYARRINHGQSEIWLEADGKELTPRKILATNEVLSVTRRHCSTEAFEAFHSDFGTTIGRVATLSGVHMTEIAVDLRLKP